MSKRILLVEDEIELREVLKDFLERESFQVIESTGGKLAFELIKDQSFDFVISDIRMPMGNGIDLAKNIQGMSGKKPRIILITGFTDVAEEDILNAGVEKVFSKPFLPEELVDYVAKN
jgi:DNA-binding response OmpR family regulator